MATVDIVYRSILVSIIHVTVLHIANTGIIVYKNLNIKNKTSRQDIKTQV